MAILLTALIAAAFLLNYEHRTSSTAAIETSLTKKFHQQVEVLTERIGEEESRRFALLETPQMLHESLFFVTDQSVEPAVTASDMQTTSQTEASTMFRRGVELLPDPAAISFFKRAARIRIETPDDRYLQISALFNLLDFRSDDGVVCRILASLNNPKAPLTDAQKKFFRSMLEERGADLARIENRLSLLIEQASQIDRDLTRKEGAYKAAIGSSILSVRNDGFALLYNPPQNIAEPLQIQSAPNGMLSSQIAPGHYATIPSEYIEETKREVQRQYRTGNVILCLMAGLGMVLIGGTTAVFKRQRQLEAARMEFIATVSHELRTPLSLIRLHAETLKHGRVPGNRIADYHQTILTEAERLTGIVNNVLDFSRMERNKLYIHPEPTDLSTLCERIVESFQNRLEQERFALENRINPNIKCTTDPLAVSQILFNLIDNAIKYSDNEKVVRIELEHSKDWNILRVSDRGIGIPDRLKKHVFEEFVRSDDNRVTARRGSGIGLCVVKRLVDEMGGRIEVADHRPTGTVVTVYLKDCNETTGS